MGMVLVHPISKVRFEEQDDGLVLVTAPDGTTGRFRPDGSHVDGELLYADPHMIDWVGGRKPANPMGRLARAAQAAQATSD